MPPLISRKVPDETSLNTLYGMLKETPSGIKVTQGTQAPSGKIVYPEGLLMLLFNVTSCHASIIKDDAEGKTLKSVTKIAA